MKTLVWVAARSDVPADRALCVVVAGRRLLLCQVGGQWRALSGTCPHQNWPLADRLVNGQFVCLLHGARFDPGSGEAVRGPTGQPLVCFPVIECDGELFIELDETEAHPEPRADARKEVCQ